MPEDDRPDPLGDALAEVRQLVSEERTLTLEELADRADMEVAMLRPLLRAVGREREHYGERDVTYAEGIAGLLRLASLDAVVRTARVRERAVRSVVVNDLGLVRDEILRPVLERAGTADEIGETLAYVAEELAPIAATLLSSDYFEILERALETELVAAGARGAGRSIEATIGFVDLVGYTSLVTRIAPEGLEDVVSEFDDLVSTAVQNHERVFVAKMIGDAAMLIGEEPGELAEVLLEIVEDRDPDRLPDMPRSAGLASGPVVIREGDYFGDPVNLAARLTSHARGWSLLADERLRDVLEGRFELTRIPEIRLRGLGKRRPLRVRNRE